MLVWGSTTAVGSLDKSRLCTLEFPRIVEPEYSPVCGYRTRCNGSDGLDSGTKGGHKGQVVFSPWSFWPVRQPCRRAIHG